MRKVAIIAAGLALATTQAAMAAGKGGAVATAGMAALAQPGAPGGTAIPAPGTQAEQIAMSLTALSAFLLGFVAAVKKDDNGGRPASP